MNFINFWQRPITLGLAATTASLDLPDGEYRLVIADAVTAATSREIVGAVVAGGAATLTRGLEDTVAQEWPGGSSICCSVTAEILSEFSRTYWGSGSPQGVVIAPGGSHYIDEESSGLWYCTAAGTFNDVPFSDWSKIPLDEGVPPVSGGFVFDGGLQPVREGILAGTGVIEFGPSVGDIYTNATLVEEGGSRTLTASSGPLHYRAWGYEDGTACVITEQLTVSAPPSP